MPHYHQHVGQKTLEDVVHSMFPNHKILRNVKKEANIVSPFTHKFLELDVWIPELHIGFEYQDPHHYISTWYADEPPQVFQARDNAKLQIMQDRGDTLILVPCWWDGTPQSLKASIRLFRPELVRELDTTVEPIPPVPPDGYFKIKSIPDVGELTQPRFAIGKYDPASWWLSEKYDGVRACWHCKHKVIYSRAGKVMTLPNPHISSYFPLDFFLDGELWFGRGYFTDHRPLRNPFRPSELWRLRFVIYDIPSLSIRKNPKPIPALAPVKTENSQKWNNEEQKADLSDPENNTPTPSQASEPVTFVPEDDVQKTNISSQQTSKLVTFSVPEPLNFAQPEHLEDGRQKTSATGPQKEEDTTFERSFSHLIQSIAPTNPFVILPAHSTCQTAHTLRVLTRGILEGEGEGVFLRKPKSVYEHGRTQNIVKIKTQRDTEARIVRVLPNPNSHKSIFICELPNNERMEITLSPMFPTNVKSPKLGDIVTISYSKVRASGNLTSRYITRIRDDLTWNDVIGINSKTRILNDVGKIVVAPKRRFTSPHGYWSKDEFRNTRAFFENFARNRNRDPFAPESWYDVTVLDVVAAGGDGSLRTYGHSVQRTITAIFPDVLFDPTKFAKLGRHFWRVFRNVRSFFDEFAAKLNFEPLVATNWYRFENKDFLAENKGWSVLSDYENELPSALEAAYPEIKFDHSRFRKGKHKHGQYIKQSR